MAFSSERLNRELIARIRLSDAWDPLDDPSERGVCDAANVGHRMALYRLLVERTNPRGAWGARDELSPFWGYASQLAWQHRSGRLSAAGPRSAAIDPSSWWGACNYALCVVPYRAAVAEGAAPDLRIEHGAFAPPNYGEAESRWRRAMRRVCDLQPGQPTEPVRFAIWEAHLASIQTATPAHAGLQASMNRAEERLAEGWVRMVDFFCTAALRTDLLMLAEHGTGDLPSRLLAEEDADGARTDLPAAECETVRRVFVLADESQLRWTIDRGAWARIMRSPAAREDVVRVLDGIFGHGLSALPGRALAAAYAALPKVVAPGVSFAARALRRTLSPRDA